jgi:glucose-6-phosphate 1-dehydrogenase
MSENLSIIVVGASGNLARTKVIPALFSLHSQGFLPDGFKLFGFARSEMTDEEFRSSITSHLTCRYTPGEEKCADLIDDFLQRCHYVTGDYGSTDAYLDLYTVIRDQFNAPMVERMFYLAVPPVVFSDVAKAIGDSGLVTCADDTPWTRVVVEKPFGRDRESSDLLTSEIAKIFTELQTYRIDHYLGKEVVQNLLVLRLSNLVFSSIWNNRYIDRVDIDWREDIGVEGRGGYFDYYGIIRDVIQNHMLQILSLVAMEPPGDLSARRIEDEKVKVLKSIPAVTRDDIVIGQYEGYRDDETVPSDSISPTYAAVRLRIENERWQGVPFYVSAGKGLDRRENVITIRFKPVDTDHYCENGSCPMPNELIMRIQPDESIILRVSTKVPGSGIKVESKDLDLRYGSVFDHIIPEAYENLLYDVVRGDKSVFIGSDELAAAWDIFTPILHELESEGALPEVYEFGSEGPGLKGLVTGQ